MEFNTIVSKDKRGASGMTIVEVLIAGTIGVLVCGVVMSCYLFGGRHLLATSNRIDMDVQARSAMDRMTREIRNARGVVRFTTNSITFLDFDRALVHYTNNLSTSELLRFKEGRSTVLLRGCRRFAFTLFGPAPADRTFDLESTTNAADCKAIQLSWDCSRKFVDSVTHTAEEKTATIVMRMK